MTIRTHYANLQVAENASQEVIRGAYRYLSQKSHPDKNPDNRAEAVRITQIINEAYAVLSDPQLKREHDIWIKAERERATQSVAQDRTGSPSPPMQPQTSSPRTADALSFVKRAWLMVLFGLATIVTSFMAYALVTGQFRAEFVVGLAFWLWVGHYAYTSLFSPDGSTATPLREQEWENKQSRLRRKTARIGWVVGFVSWPVVAILMLLVGHPLDVSGLMSAFVAAAIGFVAWSIAAVFARITGKA